MRLAPRRVLRQQRLPRSSRCSHRRRAPPARRRRASRRVRTKPRSASPQRKASVASARSSREIAAAARPSAFRFEHDREIARRERDAARGGLVARARPRRESRRRASESQKLPFRSCAVDAVARELDADSRGGQAQEQVGVRCGVGAEEREPAERVFPAVTRTRAAGRARFDDVARARGNSPRSRRREMRATCASSSSTPPPAALREMRGERFRAASRCGDAREGLGEFDDLFRRHVTAWRG